MNSYLAGMLAGIPLAIFAAGGLVGPTLSPVIGGSSSGGSATNLPPQYQSLTNIFGVLQGDGISVNVTGTNDSGGFRVTTNVFAFSGTTSNALKVAGQLTASNYYTLSGFLVIGNDGSLYVSAGSFAGNLYESGGGTRYYASPNGAVFLNSTGFGFFTNGVQFFDGQGNVTLGGILNSNAANAYYIVRTNTTSDPIVRTDFLYTAGTTSPLYFTANGGTTNLQANLINNYAPILTNANTYTYATLYTNTGSRGYLSGSFHLVSAATGLANIQLNYTNNGFGNFIPATSGAIVNTLDVPFGVFIQPNGTFRFATNFVTGAAGYVTNVTLINL